MRSLHQCLSLSSTTSSFGIDVTPTLFVHIVEPEEKEPGAQEGSDRQCRPIATFVVQIPSTEDGGLCNHSLYTKSEMDVES